MVSADVLTDLFLFYSYSQDVVNAKVLEFSRIFFLTESEFPFYSFWLVSLLSSRFYLQINVSAILSSLLVWPQRKCWVHQPTLCMLSRSVLSDSLRPQGLQPTRLLCPWDSPGKNTRVGCHFLLHNLLYHCQNTFYGIFLLQGIKLRQESK